MTDMKIAYVINSMEGGGAQTPLPDIVSALDQAGAQTTVLALSRRDGKALPALAKAGVYPIVREGKENDHLSALRWIDSQVIRLGADAVFTSLTRATLLGQIVARRRQLPIISWQHNSFLKPWNERLLRWRASASDLWVSDSSEVAKLTLSRLQLSPERSLTWPIFSADPGVPAASGWTQGQPLRLGSLGRLHQAKGYDTLINALATLQGEGWTPPVPIKITIGGMGAQKAQLESLANSLTVADLSFAGFVAEPMDFLAGLHLYLQPSRREGFCIAAHEAMQAGLPVIVSDTGEMAQTARLAGGTVVPTQDHAALAEALRAVLSHPEKLASAGAQAREVVLNRFSADNFNMMAKVIVDRLRAAQ